MGYVCYIFYSTMAIMLHVLCCSPITIDDVYKDVLEQAENLKKYA